MRSLPLLLPLLLTLVAALDCGNSGTDLGLGPTDVNVVGAYSLTSAGGQALPYEASINSVQDVELTADRIVINSDQTWSDVATYVTSSFSDLTSVTSADSTFGTYSIANSQIAFIRTVGDPLIGGTLMFTGSVSGSVLSVIFNGARFTYSR